MATERNCSDANKRQDKDTIMACRQMFERKAKGRLLGGLRAGFRRAKTRRAIMGRVGGQEGGKEGGQGGIWEG